MAVVVVQLAYHSPERKLVCTKDDTASQLLGLLVERDCAQQDDARPLRDRVVVLVACRRLGSRALFAFRGAEDLTGLDSVLHLSRSLGRRGGAGAGEAARFK